MPGDLDLDVDLDVDLDLDLDVLGDSLLSFYILVRFSFSFLSSSPFCCSLRALSMMSIRCSRYRFFLPTQATGAGGLVRFSRYISYVRFPSCSALGDEGGALVR